LLIKNNREKEDLFYPHLLMLTFSTIVENVNIGREEKIELPNHFDDRQNGLVLIRAANFLILEILNIPS